MSEQSSEQFDPAQAGVQDPSADQADANQTMEELRAALEAAREEAASNQDKYLRTRADMDNFKRRMEQRYADEARVARRELLKKLLSVRDNIERALHYGESQDSSGESVAEGVRLTAYQLDQLLQQEGVHPIETQGKPFDPHTEEAIQRVNDPNVPDHTVVQEVRKGFTLGDDILRPAQVVVSVHGDE